MLLESVASPGGRSEVASQFGLDLRRPRIRRAILQAGLLQSLQEPRADSKSTCGIMLRDKGRVVAPNIAMCDFMAGSEEQRTYIQTGICACQTTPLIGRGGIVVGMISTHWRTPHQPSEKDFQLFDILARQAADLIESISGEEKLPSSDRRIAD